VKNGDLHSIYRSRFLTAAFAGAAALSYFAMGAIPDPVERVISSAGVGVVTAVTSYAGLNIGAVAGNRAVEKILYSRQLLAIGAILASAAVGAGAGFFAGYAEAKAYALDKLTDKKVSHLMQRAPVPAPIYKLPHIN
jgi:hypothetical protein